MLPEFAPMVMSPAKPSPARPRKKPLPLPLLSWPLALANRRVLPRVIEPSLKVSIEILPAKLSALSRSGLMDAALADVEMNVCPVTVRLPILADISHLDLDVAGRPISSCAGKGI